MTRSAFDHLHEGVVNLTTGESANLHHVVVSPDLIPSTVTDRLPRHSHVSAFAVRASVLPSINVPGDPRMEFNPNEEYLFPRTILNINRFDLHEQGPYSERTFDAWRTHYSLADLLDGEFQFSGGVAGARTISGKRYTQHIPGAFEGGDRAVVDEIAGRRFDNSRFVDLDIPRHLSAELPPLSESPVELRDVVLLVEGLVAARRAAGEAS